MSEIKKLSELDDKQLNQAMDVFVEGFYNVFSSVSKDKEKLHARFAKARHEHRYGLKRFSCIFRYSARNASIQPK
jgi:hypothetical protein